MSTNKDASAYLDSLSTPSSRAFTSLQMAQEAILQLATEQLAMRSSFFSLVQLASGKFEVVAVYNQTKSCTIEIGTIASLTSHFPVLMNRINGPTPLICENLHNDPTATTLSTLTTIPCTGAYIGVPVVLSNGEFFGALSMLDPEPHYLTSIQVRLLVVLARLLATQIERDQELKERKWAEIQLSHALTTLQLANEQREHLNRMQSRFVSVVNHEFRTTFYR